MSPPASAEHLPDSKVDYRDRIYANYSSDFQDLAPKFDPGASAAWGRAYRHYLRGWLPQANTASIVDVACGGGMLLDLMHRRGYTNLRGVDLSPSQVAIARQVIQNIEQNNAIGYLGRHPNTFDLVTALDVIEHLYKDEVMRFLDAAYAALRPGGRLVLQTANADSPWGVMHRYSDFTHEIAFTPVGLGRLMKLAGFGSIEAREAGPIPFGSGPVSTARAGLWQVFRLGFKFWNVVELGVPGSGILTRIFLISGSK